MNKKYIFELAKKNSPKVQVHTKYGWYRHDVADLLKGVENIGLELGVAKGIFSKRMLNSEKFDKFYGVDIYGDLMHDTEEYLSALKHIGYEDKRYSLLRADFESAYQLFPNEYFDFIYIDGFAHTGEEGGKTIIDWYEKLKVGGILAGDDYHEDWPLVVWAVNHVAKETDTIVNITTQQEEESFCKYPTWFIVKSNNMRLQVDPLLYKLGMKEKNRIHKRRAKKMKRKFYIRRIARIFEKAGFLEISKFLNKV